MSAPRPATAVPAKNPFHPWPSELQLLRDILRFGPLLPRIEFVMLLYFTERICTWSGGKDSDDTSFRQMVGGIHGKDGKLWRAGCGLSKSSACRAINGLKCKKILKTERPQRDGAKGDLPTRYRLDLPRLHKYLAAAQKAQKAR